MDILYDGFGLIHWGITHWVSHSRLLGLFLELPLFLLDLLVLLLLVLDEPLEFLVGQVIIVVDLLALPVAASVLLGLFLCFLLSYHVFTLSTSHSGISCSPMSR